jgi:hypothetical protein
MYGLVRGCYPAEVFLSCKVADKVQKELDEDFNKVSPVLEFLCSIQLFEKVGNKYSCCDL